jgi:nicotinamidase-related amidase
MVDNIATHIKQSDYDAIIFTVFKNKPDSNFIRSLDWHKCSSEADVALPPQFKPFVTHNNVFSRADYSAFADLRLDEFLRDAGIEKVIICGVDTDACVLATAFSAFDNGYLVDVNFNLTYSDGGLEDQARAIIERSLIARQ